MLSEPNELQINPNVIHDSDDLLSEQFFELNFQIQCPEKQDFHVRYCRVESDATQESVR